ncbi:olfactory receptor 11L1-like [Lissotriton helveticus]
MIVITVFIHRRLHSPMYFFLGNLSFLDIWYIITFMPTILGGLLPEGKTISFTSCIMQCFFAGFLLATECWLLMAMAYDRYLAICFPLHYTKVMDQQLCLQLAGISWLSGFLIASCVIFPIQQLHFSKLNTIDHFFCDLGPLIQAACSDTSVVEIDIFVVSVFALLIPFPVIIVSYTFIISAIIKIPSAIGREKAFSTCSSHLLVVGIYFGSLITTYSMPKTGTFLRIGKVSSLLYTTATPLLNPIIYALRNKAIREVLGSALRKT